MLTTGAFGYLADYLLAWLLVASLGLHTWCFFRFFPQRRSPRTALVVGNVLVLGCLLGGAFLIGETYFRFLCVETDSFGVSLPARRWFAIHTQLNSLGCRDVEWTPEKPPGVRRIAFIGDSFTYGWGVERVEDRFTERLQSLFDRRAPGTVQVMNVAKPGWGTEAQIKPIRDMIDLFHVDEVVLCHVANDIEKLLPTTVDFNPIKPPEPRFFNPDSSCLLDALYRRIWLPRLPTVRGYHDWLAEGYANDEIWQRHQHNLYEVFRECREREVAIRVVLLPLLRVGGEKLQLERLHATLRRFLEVNGVEVLDVLPAMPRVPAEDLVVSPQDAHPNALSHSIFARIIWDAFYATANAGTP
ncbi:MAG: SGNH/GDSL hydrolase family protein [Planctomycetes bacterium]|nr:SGNH/GDSL hydrolase family protein [Planctomycetota bacterium]